MKYAFILTMLFPYQWAKAVIFDEDLNIITHKNCPTTKEELAPYTKAYDSRDNTIGAGFVLLNEHYDVHRWHPPLIYGRRGDADVGEGISLARVEPIYSIFRESAKNIITNVFT